MYVIKINIQNYSIQLRDIPIQNRNNTLLFASYLKKPFSPFLLQSMRILTAVCHLDFK